MALFRDRKAWDIMQEANRRLQVSEAGAATLRSYTNLIRIKAASISTRPATGSIQTPDRLQPDAIEYVEKGFHAVNRPAALHGLDGHQPR